MGTQPGAVGLMRRDWARVGRPSSTGTPSVAPASVVQHHMSQSTSTPPALTSGSSPQERSSSMVRMLTVVARGWPNRSARRSTSIRGTPCRASVTPAASPAGPAPTTRTGTSMSSIWIASFHETLCFPSDMVSFVGRGVKRIV